MSTAVLFTRDITRSRVINRILGVSVFIILTTLGAFVRIPLGFTPVPITLQTFFVLLSGAVLGPNLGILSQIGYLFLGALGLSVFAGAGSGLSGPTVGYILGFVLASFTVGRLIRGGWSITKSNMIKSTDTGYIDLKFWRIFLYMFIGNIIIHTFGCLWLCLVFKFPINQVILVGCLPFIPGDIIKLIGAAWVYKNIQTRAKEVFC